MDQDRHLPAESREEIFAPPGAPLLHKVGYIVSLPVAAVLGGAALVGFALGTLDAFVLLGLAAADLFAGFMQRRKAECLEHYQIYTHMLVKTMKADVHALARAAGITDEKCRKELEWLMKKGMFLEGHFSFDRTVFLASDKAYENYRNAQIAANEQQALAAQEQEKEDELDPEVRKMLERGKAYESVTERARLAAPDPAVAAKFLQVKEISRKIFAEIGEHPEKAPKLKNLMSYYLPTTTKLFTSYVELKDSDSEKTVTARKDVEGALDSLIEAYDTIYDSLFEDNAVDVSSDVSVLKSMMKQDGLVPDDMRSKKKKEKEVNE